MEEAIFSSEMSVDFVRTTRRYITEDRVLHNHRCENLKFYIPRIFRIKYIFPPEHRFTSY
jgi:hypothetical protein